MSTALLPLARLQDWWDEHMDRRTVKVSGGLRGTPKADSPTVDLLELRTAPASTVRLLIPEEPPVVEGNSLSAAQFKQTKGAKGIWWGGWATVLAATALVPPVVDPKRLAHLLQDTRRLRLYCDTNALAGGVADWLMFLFDGRADLVTSAVVDRELAAWPDQESNLWGAKTVDLWSKRTQYRLARRVTETPPPGVVIDRLSPEQGALMLAKLRDESSNNKSPDADLLLIELARALVRDQPRQARVIYLTGDRNNARAATTALGPESVLYAAADGKQVHKSLGKIVVPGWWSPGGPLGAVRLVPSARILWGLLAAFEFLRFETEAGSWLLRPALSVNRGVPSDWAEPWIEIDLIDRPSEPTAKATPSSPAQEPAGPLPGRVRSRRGGRIQSRSESLGDERFRQYKTENIQGNQGGDWLLPPMEQRAIIEGLQGFRWLTNFNLDFFSFLWDAVSGAFTQIELVGPGGLLDYRMAAAHKVLIFFEALDQSGAEGRRLEDFRRAWYADDLDWLHAELLRIPYYNQAMNSLRPGNAKRLLDASAISMARKLGQVVPLEGRPDTVGFALGNAPVKRIDLQEALERWLPKPGDTLDTKALCERAAVELHLTPARFERALKLLWERSPDPRFEGSTGGTTDPGPAEEVVELDETGYRFRKVAPGALTFGRSGPVRFLRRVR
jgi:hypothetical protein